MTIALSAYETSACRGFVMNKLIGALKAAFAESATMGLVNVEGKEESYKVDIRCIVGNPTKEQIPAFMHPVIIDNGNEEFKDTVIDVRATGRWDSNQHAFQIRNNFEFDFMKMYGLLAAYWVTAQGPRILSSISNLPLSLYSRWLSENITRRFGLTPQDQLIISIMAAYFYLGNFTNEERFSENEFNRLVGVIAKATYASADYVFDVLNDRPIIKSADEFCERLQEATGNIRLAELNRGLLVGIIGGTWFGTNARELVAVALEYPPAWILIAYSSYMDRSYKNTAIAKASTRDKRQDVELFVRGLKALLISQ